MGRESTPLAGTDDTGRECRATPSWAALKESPPVPPDAKKQAESGARVFAACEMASLSLREHREPRGQQEIHLDLSREGATDTSVDGELLIFCKI